MLSLSFCYTLGLGLGSSSFLLCGFVLGFTLELVQDASHLVSAWRYDLDKPGRIHVHGNLEPGAGGAGVAHVVVEVLDRDRDPLSVKTFFVLGEGRGGGGGGEGRGGREEGREYSG